MIKKKKELHLTDYTDLLHSSHLFSVIITTYNRSELIKRALDSLISQTEPDWEAIIVDDESRDDTYCQLLPYLKKEPRIIYIRQPHSGEAAAKNSGLFTAKGKFVTFLDSDDEFTLQHLASRKSILLQNPGVMFLHGGVKIIGNQYVPDRFDNSVNIKLSDCVIGGTFFIERELAISLGGFKDITIGTDADLFERAVKKGVRIIKSGEPTYIYHHETEDSITNKMYAGL